MQRLSRWRRPDAQTAVPLIFRFDIPFISHAAAYVPCLSLAVAQHLPVPTYRPTYLLGHQIFLTFLNKQCLRSQISYA